MTNDAMNKTQNIKNIGQEYLKSYQMSPFLENAIRSIHLKSFRPNQKLLKTGAPLECGQFATPIQTITKTIELLNIKEHHKVLEIGTGSGLQTAIIAKLVRRLFSIERCKTLCEKARNAFKKNNLSNIFLMCANGAEGWPSHAPFDRIIINASISNLPCALVEQVEQGGMLVAPLEKNKEQNICTFSRAANGWEIREFYASNFTPLENNVTLFL